MNLKLITNKKMLSLLNKEANASKTSIKSTCLRLNLTKKMKRYRKIKRKLNNLSRRFSTIGRK